MRPDEWTIIEQAEDTGKGSLQDTLSGENFQKAILGEHLVVERMEDGTYEVRLNDSPDAALRYSVRDGKAVIEP